MKAAIDAARRLIDVRAGAVLLLAAFLIPATWTHGWLEPFERQALNAAFHIRGPRTPESPVVIVAIDEGSFDELELPWPWPRRLHGRVFETLREAGAIAIGVDLIFAEPSAWGEEDDREFAEGIRRAEVVVLGAALTSVDEAQFAKVDLNPPLPEIRKHAAAFGPVNLLRDEDAFVRSAKLSHEHQGRELPSFVARILEVAGRAGVQATASPGDEPILINYRGGPRSFPTFPYHRIVQGELSHETFRGKIVLVGATSPALHDVFPTPFAGRGDMPGVEIHANLLETILRDIALHRPPRFAACAIALLALLAAVWLTERLGLFTALAAIVGIAAAYELGAFFAFAQASLWLDFATPPLALTAGFMTTSTLNFLREQREKRRLSRFFSPEVVKEIVRQRDEQALGSARRLVTVLFCDIRDFTSISERLAPEEVATLLREYLTEMTDAVFQHGGTIDKFIGDAVMALFNAPLEHPEHATNAVRTALELQARVRRLSTRWQDRTGMTLRNGVGIHTGEAIVGTLGSEQRLEYTAIGDTVNLASRIEGLTKQFGAPIVVSESTYAAVERDYPGRWLGEVTVKGKEIPVKVYAIPVPGT